MLYLKQLVLIVFCLNISGCATVVRGTHEELRVVSIPPGAKVSVWQETSEDEPPTYICYATPCALNLSRRYNARIEVSLDGHQAINFEVIRSTRRSKTLIKPGTIVAGVTSGSYVTAGEPNWIENFSGLSLTYLEGTYSPLPMITGARYSLSPNPVTVTLAPVKKAIDKLDDMTGSGTIKINNE